MPPFSVTFEIPAEPEVDLDSRTRLVRIAELKTNECDFAIVQAFDASGTLFKIPGRWAIHPANGWPHTSTGVAALFALTASGNYLVDTVQRDNLEALPQVYSAELHGESYTSRGSWEAEAAAHGFRPAVVLEEDSVAPVTEEETPPTSARDQATDWLAVLLLWDLALGIKTHHDDWKAECIETYRISSWAYDRQVWGDAREVVGFKRRADPGAPSKK